jgi:hypothetical protein
MTVTRERFEQGMTYDQFKDQMTRNRERFEANERRLELDPGDLAAFRGLPRMLDVLVLAEDWCGDVIDNLPILGRLAKESGKLDLRVFLRDQNADLMDQYLNRGTFRSIPVFAFFDAPFAEVGRFIERPDSVTERRRQRMQGFYAQHPEIQPGSSVATLSEELRAQYGQAMAEVREQSRDDDVRDVLRALRQIVERVRA